MDTGSESAIKNSEISRALHRMAKLIFLQTEELDSRHDPSPLAPWNLGTALY